MDKRKNFKLFRLRKSRAFSSWFVWKVYYFEIASRICLYFEIEHANNAELSAVKKTAQEKNK